MKYHIVFEVISHWFYITRGISAEIPLVVFQIPLGVFEIVYPSDLPEG